MELNAVLRRTSFGAIVGAVALSGALSGSVFADPPGRGLNSESATRVRVAATMLDREDQLTAAEAAVVAVTAEQQKVAIEIVAESRNLKRVLAAVERVAIQPPDSALLVPESIDDSVRAAIALRSMVPPIQEKLAKFRKDLTDLADLHQQTLVRRDQALAAKRDLDLARQALAALPQPAADPATVALAVRRADQAAQHADTPTDFIKSLNTLPPEPSEHGQPIPSGQAAATASPSTPVAAVAPPPLEGLMPARGHILHGFGDSSGNALTSRGLSIGTRSGSEVVATSSGRVVFAGVFRGYGQLLILEHPGGYHTLLSGLGRIDTGIGHEVLAGEPVGVMGDESTPVLYVELRHEGQPIDPVPWLMSRTKG